MTTRTLPATEPMTASQCTPSRQCSSRQAGTWESPTWALTPGEYSRAMVGSARSCYIFCCGQQSSCPVHHPQKADWGLDISRISAQGAQAEAMHVVCGVTRQCTEIQTIKNCSAPTYALATGGSGHRPPAATTLRALLMRPCIDMPSAPRLRTPTALWTASRSSDSRAGCLSGGSNVSAHFKCLMTALGEE